MQGRPKAVFDCGVFLQAAISPTGPAYFALQNANIGRVELLISDEVFAELEAVLSRPSLQRKFPSLTPERVSELLTLIRELSTFVPGIPSLFQYSRDPDDEPYLNLAIFAKADFLVSRDRDLLDLADQQNPEGQRLALAAPTLKIMNPVEFLKAITPAIPRASTDTPA